MFVHSGCIYLKSSIQVYIGMMLNAEYVFLSKLINAYFDSAKLDGTRTNV